MSTQTQIVSINLPDKTKKTLLIKPTSTVKCVLKDLCHKLHGNSESFTDKHALMFTPIGTFHHQELTSEALVMPLVLKGDLSLFHKDHFINVYFINIPKIHDLSLPIYITPEMKTVDVINLIISMFHLAKSAYSLHLAEAQGHQELLVLSDDDLVLNLKEKFEANSVVFLFQLVEKQSSVKNFISAMDKKFKRKKKNYVTIETMDDSQMDLEFQRVIKELNLNPKSYANFSSAKKWQIIQHFNSSPTNSQTDNIENPLRSIVGRNRSSSTVGSTTFSKSLEYKPPSFWMEQLNAKSASSQILSSLEYFHQHSLFEESSYHEELLNAGILTVFNEILTTIPPIGMDSTQGKVVLEIVLLLSLFLQAPSGLSRFLSFDSFIRSLFDLFLKSGDASIKLSLLELADKIIFPNEKHVEWVQSNHLVISKIASFKPSAIATDSSLFFIDHNLDFNIKLLDFLMEIIAAYPNLKPCFRNFSYSAAYQLPDEVIEKFQDLIQPKLIDVGIQTDTIPYIDSGTDACNLPGLSKSDQNLAAMKPPRPPSHTKHIRPTRVPPPPPLILKDSNGNPISMPPGSTPSPEGSPSPLPSPTGRMATPIPPPPPGSISSPIPPPPPGSISSPIPPPPGSMPLPIPPPPSSFVPPPPGSMSLQIPPPPGGTLSPIPPPPLSSVPPPPGSMSSPIPPPPGSASSPIPPPPGGLSLPIPTPPGSAMLSPYPGGVFQSPMSSPSSPFWNGTPKTPEFVAPEPLKKTLKPRVSVKGLFWNKIGYKEIKDTVWADLDDEKVKLNTEELEEYFRVAGVAKENADPGKVVGPAKPSEIRLLELNRGNNISIMLARIKLSYAEIKQGIIDLDDKKISMETLQMIKNFLPTIEEIEMLKEYKGKEDDRLGKAECYMLELISISELNQRINTWIYMRKFAGDYAELMPDVQAMRSTLCSLEKSQSIRDILTVALAIGNYLNGSTARGKFAQWKINFQGQAFGFKLDSLLKLKDTKSNNSKDNVQSLLHYLVKVLQKDYPSCLNFLDEISDIEKAIKINWNTLKSSISMFVNGFNKIKRAVERLLEKKIEEEEFHRKLKNFVSTNQSQVEELEKEFKLVEAMLVKVEEFYGESTKTGIEDFLQIFITFESQLKKALKDLSATTATRPAPMAAMLERRQTSYIPRR